MYGVIHCDILTIFFLLLLLDEINTLKMPSAYLSHSTLSWKDRVRTKGKVRLGDTFEDETNDDAMVAEENTVFQNETENPNPSLLSALYAPLLSFFRRVSVNSYFSSLVKYRRKCQFKL